MGLSDAPESHDAAEAPSSFAASRHSGKRHLVWCECSTLPAGSRSTGRQERKIVAMDRELTFFDQDHAGKAIVRVPQVD